MRKNLYSVTFEYVGRDGEWAWSIDHRCMATSAESAISMWTHKGYGVLRNARAQELTSL